MKRLLFLSIFLCLFFPVQAHASTLYAGTGQSVSTTPELTVMGQSAAVEAKNSYNASGGSNSPPKLILIMNNAGDNNSVLIPAIRGVFGNSVPILGSEDGWADYTPYTVKQIPADNNFHSLSVMALGGDAITVSWATGIGNFNSNDNAQAQIGGKDLATKLGAPVAGKNNLILTMGPLHGDLGTYATAGMKQVYGSPLPSNLRIVGWAGSYWGANIYDNGERKGNQMLGIKITGDFKWSFTGINHGVFGWDGSGEDLGDPVVAITNQYQKVIAELGSVPTASFMVIAHPDRSLFPAIRNGIATKIGTRAMIGMHGGSETGHDTTAGDVISEGSHFFLAGISANTGTVSTPMPTAIPVCRGDINGDKIVDLSDYSLLVHNFLQSPLLNQKADLNADGIVDLSDYSLLVRNFFATCP